jgi:hypothetical protein
MFSWLGSELCNGRDKIQPQLLDVITFQAFGSAKSRTDLVFRSDFDEPFGLDAAEVAAHIAAQRLL